jgi:hypothetical protein
MGPKGEMFCDLKGLPPVKQKGNPTNEISLVQDIQLDSD